MAMLGTPVDMQCSYFPRYYTTGDLNLNPGCSTWPLNNVDRSLLYGYHYNGGLSTSSPDQNLSYKEIVKQTMLQHEAVFRNQIRELHRVYNRQRELMEEMKNNELYRHHLWLRNVESNPNMAENSLENSQKTFQVSSLAWLNPACSQSSVLGVENNILPSSFIGQKATEAVCNPSQPEYHVQGVELLESRCKKVGKKILDLELPAAEYVDSDEEVPYVTADLSNYPLRRVSENVQKSDAEPLVGGVDLNVVFQEDNVNLASFTWKTNGLADLNEPVKLEEESDPEFNDFTCPVPVPREIPYPDLPGKLNSDYQVEPETIFQITPTNEDPEAGSNALLLEKNKDKNETERECLSDNDETGKSSSDLNSFSEVMFEDALSLSSEDTEIAQAQDVSASHLLDQGNRTLKRTRKVAGLENFKSDFSSCKYTSNELIPLADVMNNESSLVSSWRRHTHDCVRAPIAVQALPCFNPSAKWKESSESRGHGIVGDETCCSKNVNFNPKFHSSHFQSSSGNESVSEDYGTQKHTKDSACVKSPMVVDLNSVSSSCSSDGEKILEDSYRTGPCLRERAKRIGKSSKIFKELNQVEFVLAKTLENSFEDDNANRDMKDRLIDINLDGHSLQDDLLVQNRHDKKFSGFGFSIDLNSCINEDESPSIHSASTEIYLEAPVSPENKESSPPRGESDENQLETPCESGFENGYLIEELNRIAAEALVSISSSQVQYYLENATSKPIEMLHVDSLYWFARVVSSVEDDPESEFGVVPSCKDTDDHDEYLSDDLDYFEAMTLKLKESRVEEYFCKTYVEEEEAALSSLPSQPRKGRTRGRRQQRKDFQSEILPSLASLSRYEVTEDLQAIGGLIQAAQRSTGARKASRNGRPRGRMRRSSLSLNVERRVCLHLSQQTRHNELATQVRSLVGWSMITKRRTGQRCRATNPRLIIGEA